MSTANTNDTAATEGCAPVAGYVAAWCEHIKWEESWGHEWKWWIDLEWGIHPPQEYAQVPDTWTVCPVCSAPRPHTDKDQAQPENQNQPSKT